MSEYYFYGLAALLYLSTCWTFSAVRWFHTCRAPKERHKYIWPDRKLQCLIYLCATILLPYIINPASPSAWMLEKSYFPACYYFYCGVLLLCFFGTVKQWNQWKSVSWTAALIVVATMLVPALDAWLPSGILNAQGLRIWNYVVLIESIIMMGYSALAMWQVKHWMDEARDQNYSNPDDFPADYARRVWLAPVLFTPLLWPAYIWDSPLLMAIENVLLAASNILLLLNVMPVWRRKAILSSSETDIAESSDEQIDDNKGEQIEQTIIEIESYVKNQQAYLNPHLKIDDVVAHTRLGRTNVSITISRKFVSFANYVNSLRLAHFEQYLTQHPGETKESAALASGFSSYTAYYRAKQKYECADENQESSK
ncbi:MAG: AraC family transcriptional regulator [Prevotella sp.]|nr:AraC family transcriptional regulator [Prevotella sp.]